MTCDDEDATIAGRGALVGHHERGDQVPGWMARGGAARPEVEAESIDGSVDEGNPPGGSTHRW